MTATRIALMALTLTALCLLAAPVSADDAEQVDGAVPCPVVQVAYWSPTLVSVHPECLPHILQSP